MIFVFFSIDDLPLFPLGIEGHFIQTKAQLWCHQQHHTDTQQHPETAAKTIIQMWGFETVCYSKSFFWIKVDNVTTEVLNFIFAVNKMSSVQDLMVQAGARIDYSSEIKGARLLSHLKTNSRTCIWHSWKINIFISLFCFIIFILLLFCSIAENWQHQVCKIILF